MIPSRRIEKGKFKNGEIAFQDIIESYIEKAVLFYGYKGIKIYREYKIANKFIDFLCFHSDGIIVFEVKKTASNKSDIYYASAIGQILYYRALISAHYDKPIDKIKPIVIIDKEEEALLSTIWYNNIPIEVWVFDHEKITPYIPNFSILGVK